MKLPEMNKMVKEAFAEARLFPEFEVHVEPNDVDPRTVKVVLGLWGARSSHVVGIDDIYDYSSLYSQVLDIKDEAEDLITTRGYRIVEVDRGYKTLFHGIQGSRTIEPGVWYKADRKMVVDGKGQNPYESGFNFLLSMDAAKKYLSRFTAPRTLQIVEISVVGIRPKPTNENVYLADYMRLNWVLG